MPSPKKAVAYTLNAGLVDQAARPSFKASPTLAAGDFKISRDNSALSNLATLPVVLPASGRIVKIVLSATEMTADRITVQCVDAAGAEWDDLMIHIATDGVTLSDIHSLVSDLSSDVRSVLVVMSGVQSDIYSALSDFQSDFQSRVPKRVATDSQLSDLSSDLKSMMTAGVGLTTSAMSDVASQVWAHAVGTRIDSRILVIQSSVSDVYSMLSDHHSDFQSRVPKLVANNSQLSDLASDLRSFLVVMSGIQSDIYSAISDFQSDFQSRVPKKVATDSQLSDLASDIVSDMKSFIGAGVPADASTMSDIRSAIAAGPAATVTASDISDIASAVWAYNSSLRIAHLGASDLSDLRSAISAGAAGTLTVSDISDIASAVWANTIGARVDSRILLNQSRISDTYSMVSDMLSDFQSRVPKRVATDSQLSDLASDLRSFLVVMSGVQSDMYSAVSDLQSDFQSRVPKRVATDSQLSDVSSDIRSLILAGVGFTVSGMSDVASQVWAHAVGTRVDSRILVTQSMASDVFSQVSDIRSQLIAGTFALGASNISDVASAVRATIVSDLSDILSAAVQINSRVLVNKSGVSDIYSLLTAGASLDASTMSDIRSAIAGGAAATVSASDISDIASAVRAAIVSDLSDIMSAVQQASSRVLVSKSTVSDIYSLLVAGVTLDASTLSDVRSAITAGGGGGTGTGSIQVNHNYGGADALRYLTSGGIPIDNAEIVAFLKTDYDAGNWEPAFEKGRTTTNVDGRWAQSLMLDAGTYTIRASRQLDFGPDTREVVIA